MNKKQTIRKLGSIENTQTNNYNNTPPGVISIN